ncbi:MAG TPA: hypothetical protein DCE42_15720 [Myxococcales bacterium]|nr:hypothetical protein [Deltaproteobacteria bacterium]MBU47382.1 hypothetical protein [Deltaproteobacteria bacterium]HAA56212.1 hypothetical protein [Myxococcales bacterium]
MQQTFKHPGRASSHISNPGIPQKMRSVPIYFRSGWLLFFLIFSCFASESLARPLHFDYFHVTPPMKPASQTGQWIDGKLNGWYRQKHMTPPTLELGLQAAAQRLAQRLAKRPLRHLPHKIVQSALWLSGNADHKLRIFAMAFGSRKQLWTSLQRALKSRLAGQYPTHFGLGLTQTPASICVLIMSRRGAHLSPFPRRVRENKTYTLRGQLLPGFSQPKLVIGTPTGKVIRIPLVVNAGGAFSYNWTFKMVGFYRFQIVLQDERGPWVSSQWDVRSLTKGQSSAKIWKRAFAFHKKRLWAHKKPKKRALLPTTAWTAKSAETALWKLVNAQRSKQNLTPLKREVRLHHLAKQHAKDMVKDGYFGHTSPQHGSFAERFQRLRWHVKRAGENIVVAKHPKEALRLFLQSPTHRGNIYDPKAKLTGVAAVLDTKGQIYFVQIFVTP